MKQQLLIGGRFIDGEGDELIIYDPATEEPVSVLSLANRDQLDQAVAAARLAFDDGPWPRLGGRERAELLHALASAILQHRDPLAELLVREVGSPVSAARSGPQTASKFLHWYADAAHRDLTRPLPSQPGQVPARAVVRYLPVGVVGAIAAYNSPLMMAVIKLGGVLAAGCTLVLMPSPQAPLSTLMLGRIAQEVGLPDGVLNIVVGDAAVARRLTEHQHVDKVTFTGSIEIGAAVARQSACSVTASVLELGGKSPCLLLPDVDLDLVVPSLLPRLFNGAGQSCQAPSRIFVHDSRYDEFVKRARTFLKGLVVGDPRNEATQIGPVISAAHRLRVQKVVDDAIANDGAEVLARAELPQVDRGHWVAPTLLGGVGNKTSICQKEIFGPIGVVLSYETVQQAIAMANDSRYGLAAYVFGSDRQAALDVASRLRAGSVYVNGGNMRPDAPSGGLKQSGIGRENGEEGILEFLEPQHLCWATADGRI